MSDVNKSLYMVHCGFYADQGIYESHTNFFVAASNSLEAKKEVKKIPLFLEKHMHIDSMLELNSLSGFNIKLVASDVSESFNIIKHRELSPKNNNK